MVLYLAAPHSSVSLLLCVPFSFSQLCFKINFHWLIFRYMSCLLFLCEEGAVWSWWKGVVRRIFVECSVESFVNAKRFATRRAFVNVNIPAHGEKSTFWQDGNLKSTRRLTVFHFPVSFSFSLPLCSIDFPVVVRIQQLGKSYKFVSAALNESCNLVACESPLGLVLPSLRMTITYARR